MLLNYVLLTTKYKNVLLINERDIDIKICYLMHTHTLETTVRRTSKEDMM